jgi:hypothetical protein
MGRIVSNVKEYRYFSSAKAIWIFLCGAWVPIKAKELVRMRNIIGTVRTVEFVGGEVEELW